MKKTNAARLLDRLKIKYRLLEYVYDHDDLSALGAAQKLNVPKDQIFKTLVARGDKTGIITASIPGDHELDLKALAKLSKNKKVELIALKELQPLTGYLRGAVSPLGMNNTYPYYLDKEANKYHEIIVSAGLRGLQIALAPADLVRATSAVTGKITRINS